MRQEGVGEEFTNSLEISVRVIITLRTDECDTSQCVNPLKINT